MEVCGSGGLWQLTDAGKKIYMLPLKMEGSEGADR